jgi:sigma-B regulation protein RsbQ
MDTRARNNVTVSGNGTITMVFAHGFGCDQSMWRYLVPEFERDFRVVLFDLVGSGKSHHASYDRDKYGTLHGHAADVLDVVEAFSTGPVVLVGHSVSAMICMLAAIERPERIVAQVMVGPSPCYVNDGDYIGGFGREDIDELLETLENNYLGWSSTMAPVIMGAPGQPELSAELTNSFCRTDPDIAKHFARVTFLSDHRAELSRCAAPTLILQCSDDIIAPIGVGQYMHRMMPASTLRIIDNVGHCPHLSAPAPSTQAMREFLSPLIS